MNKVPHGGHERQSNAKGNCEHQKWNTLQDGGYIPTRLWPLECHHLLQQKLTAHQMQNSRKNSPPSSETSYPSQIKATTRFRKLEAGSLHSFTERHQFLFWTNTPDMRSSIQHSDLDRSCSLSKVHPIYQTNNNNNSIRISHAFERIGCNNQSPT